MEKEFEGQAEPEIARITVDDVEYGDGVFRCKARDKTMTFKDMAADGAHGRADYWSCHGAATRRVVVPLQRISWMSS